MYKRQAKAFVESLQGRAGRAESDAAFWRGKTEAVAEESSRWQRSSEEAVGKVEGFQSRIRALENELATLAEKLPSKEKTGS